MNPLESGSESVESESESVESDNESVESEIESEIESVESAEVSELTIILQEISITGELAIPVRGVFRIAFNFHLKVQKVPIISFLELLETKNTIRTIYFSGGPNIMS